MLIDSQNLQGLFAAKSLSHRSIFPEAEPEFFPETDLDIDDSNISKGIVQSV